MTLHDQDAFRRAHRVSEAAARRGFDWPNAEGPLAKLEEELEELRVAHAEGDPERTSAELGDLLFAAVNLARHLGQDSGACLLATVARFEARWAYVRAKRALG